MLVQEGNIPELGRGPVEHDKCELVYRNRASWVALTGVDFGNHLTGTDPNPLRIV